MADFSNKRKLRPCRWRSTGNGIPFATIVVAVAPGVVDTPLHKNSPNAFLKTLSPMGTISDSKDIADAVVYLTEARHVTGEVLHVDGGVHVGRW
jgi:NAD(P)-dependent dehydrogenase (short-subunit alcohol dehydrogenase family)